MSPDIEWRVGEGADQETIARTSTTRRSRFNRWVVIGAVGLGVGLGVLYRSIPEPPPQRIDPAPIPTVIAAPLAPRPTPESLDAAIERDAKSLASMDIQNGVAFNPALARLPQVNADWYAALQNAFSGWGSPDHQPLYTVFESGTLPSGVRWVTLGQLRHGNLYRQTRFYRLENDHWIWTLPDLSFWSGKTAVVTTGDAGTVGPITIGHPIEDAPVVGAVFDRFARVYQTLCDSLNCPSPIARTGLSTPGLTLSLTIQPTLMQPAVQDRLGTLLIDLPSPNVVGNYAEANGLGDPYVAMAYATLIDPVVQLASGDYLRWNTDSGGSLFLKAIATWKRARLPSNLYLLGVFYQSAILPPSMDISPDGWPVSRRARYVDQLRGTKLIALTDLWTWPSAGYYYGPLGQAATQEAEAVIIYIEEKYGRDGVVRFLNALGKARSLETAISTALPIEFAEFNQQWTKWIAGE
ncbi:MAG TPA: hypothetical protein VMP08_09780 [Anaerolineae bacterium]|nr:hypothetical protein [Anaerolineae bacterium]